MFVVDSVKQYLSVEDDRFCVRVYDNHSTDGTYEELQKISDSRLELHQNKENLGFLKNSLLALRNANSDYIVFNIDKNRFNVQYLKEFLDMFEKYKPNYGYIDLNYVEPTSVRLYKSGIEAIINGGGYACRHPNGYFYKSALFDSIVSDETFSNVDPYFAFPFDIVSGELGVQNDAMVFNIPLSFKCQTPEFKKTYTYNEYNFYFGKKYTLLNYRYFMQSMLKTGLTDNEKKELLDRYTQQLFTNVSYRLRNLYADDGVCYRYNLQKRAIGVIEMIRNIGDAIKEAKSVSLLSNTPYSYSYLIRLSKNTISEIAKSGAIASLHNLLK